MELDTAYKVFLEEATEILQIMEDQLLELEAIPDNMETINALFRGAHTIKGASGMIGLTEIERFTHKVESVMDKLRNGEICVEPAIINLLLRCRDHMTELVKNAGNNSETSTESLKQGTDTLVEDLSLFINDNNQDVKQQEKTQSDTAPATQTEPSLWHVSMRFNKNVLRDAMDPLSLINYLRRTVDVVNLTTITDAITGLAEMDPEECHIGFEIDLSTTKSQKEIEDIFEFYSEDNNILIIPPNSKAETYVKLINDLPEDTWRLGEVLVKSGLLSDESLSRALRKQNEARSTSAKDKMIGEVLVEEGIVEKSVVEAALEKQQKVRDAINCSGPAGGATIRVDADKLDMLINLVGELVVANGGIRQRSLTIGDSPLMKSTSFMTKLVNDIRDMSMKMRMVPIGNSFNRFNRLVRDKSRELFKEIDLIITGGETELDKTVIEKINDPLTHIVRNAVDHGIEPLNERIERGKSPRGKIKLDAYYDAGTIVMEITDDGRGLNKQKITEKAISLGLIDSTKNMTDNEIFNLIFEPGVSTAKAVTDLSGRGVGMDVVKRNVESLRGSVFVSSVEGEGTKVRINLPLTLSIIDGFMVGIANKHYVIPLDMVVKCYSVNKSAYAKIKRQGYFDFQGKVIPFIALCKIFELNRSDCNHLVIVTHGGQKAAIGVDKLYGDMQAVIKSLGNMYKDVSGFSGATILGDGSVALILDIQGILRQLEPERLATA